MTAQPDRGGGAPGSTYDVEVENVSKRFGDYQAITDLSLRISPGQFVTLLGPSGCGKTTTLRLIGGFELPDSGRVSIRGRPVDGPRNSLTRMVFQNYALFPHMTVGQNVAFGLEMQHRPKARKRELVERALETVGIPERAGAFPGQLSGGQQQRVALARALVTEPDVLLLDEPLGALDLQMRKRMQDELKRLQRESGITFLYVTHDQGEALAMSDLVIVMDEGTIVQVGSPEEVYSAPATRYVANFVGDSNLFDGTILEIHDGVASVETELGVLTGVRRGARRSEAGRRVALAIRPERISLQAVDGRAAIAGRVVDRVFLGSSTRVVVEVAGVVKVLADHPGTSSLEVDDPVSISWRVEDAIVVDP